MKHILYTLTLILAFPTSVAAQTVITGFVKDTKDIPVIGAAVMVDGMQAAGSVTDIDGKYALTIPASAGSDPVLTVSCLSYLTQKVRVGGRTVIDIVLKEDSQQLEEVVVVGYGAMRRSDLTGSVTSVKLDEDEAAQASTVDQMLQGKAAGVSVMNNGGAPDGGVSVRVRGVTSLSGSNEPLYVIDGVIMTPAASPVMFTQGTDNTGSDEEVNSMMGINPQDIASMEILKDASATAIYGSAGANGVVLITTKQAGRDKPVVKVNIGLDLAAPVKYIDMLSFDEYQEYLKAQGGNYLSQLYEDNDVSGKLAVQGVNWQKYMMRPVLNQRYYLSVSGRPKTMNYSFSAGYNKRNGIIRNTGNEQFTLRMNVTKTFFKDFTLGTKTNVAYIDSEMTQGASSTRLNASSSLMRSMMISKPYMRLDGQEETDLDDLVATPYKWVSEFRNTRKEYRITPHLFAEWKILRWLEFKSSVGGDFRLSRREKWKGPSVNSGPEGAIGAVSDISTYSWNWDNTLNFNTKIRRHRISGTLGVTTGRTGTVMNVSEGWNISEHKLQIENINSAVNTRFAYNETYVSTNSYFARLLYNYDDRYLLTATCRVDGSSKFSRQNRYSVFPSFAFAWRITEERWFNADRISSMKLRLGWGQVGNSGVAAYQIYSTYSPGPYADHTPDNRAEYVMGLIPDNIANPSLKWETTRQVNVGFDIGFWDGRLALSADLYDKNTFDLLQRKKIPGTTGYQTMWVNDGSISNRGVELTVEAAPVVTEDWEWNISGNISFNRNRLTDIALDAGAGSIYLAPGRLTDTNYYLGNNIGTGDYFNAPANIFIQGQPAGLFYGYMTCGILQEGQTLPKGVVTAKAPAQPGMICYRDLDGNGTLDLEDRTVIGDPNPDFTYGFSTTLKWKRFYFMLSCNGSYGNDIVNANLLQESDISRITGNVRRDVFYDSWTPERLGAKYPAIGKMTSDEVKYMSDRIVEDGSYLRIANVSLSYRIPLPKNKVVRNMSVGASVKNAYVFTGYSGWDPDVNSYGSDMSRLGVDCGSYPTARTFCFDLKFTF